MRTELMQMDRMGIDERFGTQAGEAMRVRDDMIRRMRRERRKMEEEQDEFVRDQSGD